MNQVVKVTLSVLVIISIITSGFIGIIAFLGIIDNAGVSGANITVAQDGGGDYTIIQDAIDNANAGDTIYVWAGLYYENIQIDKTLSLIGNGSATTIINGSHTGDVVNVSADWVNITGFTIQDSGNQVGAPFPVDCGIEIFYADDVHIYDNNCSANQFGIFINFSNRCIIEDNEIVWNSFHGVVLYYSENCSFLNNIVFSNTWDGILLIQSHNSTAINNLCTFNNGHGMVISSSNWCNVINNSYYNNNNGLNLFFCYNVLINENKINNNNWDGFHLTYSHINVFSNNTFISNFNNGIYLEECLNNVFSNNTIVSNSNNGIELDFSSDRNLFYKNNFSQNSNGIYIDDSSDYNDFTENIISSNSGRGIYIRSSCNYNTFYHNFILSNTNQATDESINYWSYNQEGNYWSDYTGLDNGNNGRMKGDGIGDTKLPHPAPGMDSFPFIEPYGWLYPGIPVLLDPGEISINGDYKIIWNETVRALGYILEEDTTGTFVTSIEIFNESGHELMIMIEDKPAGTYYYRVRSYNEDYVSDWSNIVNITVDGPPAKPIGLIYYNITAHSVTLEWTPNTDADLLGYHVLINNSDNTPPFSRIASVLANQFKYTVTNLNEETAYLFAIMAFDIYHINSTISEEVKLKTLDATAPAAPKDLEAYTESDTKIDLTWTANTESDISGYIIFMNETASGPTGKFLPVVILNSSHTTFTVIGLTEQTTYYFKIKAFDEVPNNSSFSNVTSATTLDLTPPSAPEGLKIVNPTINSLTITWNASPELDVEGYFIYQGTLKDGQFTKLNNESLIELQYTDTGLEEYTRSFYKIQAIDDVGLNSSYSKVVTGKTLLGPKPVELNNSVDDFEMAEDSYDNTSISLYHVFMDPNDDPLAFTVEGEDYLTVTIFQGNGTVIIRPEPEWSGSETIMFFATDGTKEVWFEVEITVTPVNDPPGPAKILSFDDGLKITQGEALDLEGECNDIDIPYGDELIFKWYSSKSGQIGTGKLVENVVLSAGTHVITLEVSDKAGVSANATATVTVQKKETTDTDAMGLIIPIAGVIIIVIVLIALFMVMRKKKKPKGEEKEVDSDKLEKETPPEQTQQPVQPPVVPMMPPGIQPVIGMPGQPLATVPPMPMQMPMTIPMQPQPLTQFQYQPQPGTPQMQPQMQMTLQPPLQTPPVPPPNQEQTQQEPTTAQPDLPPNQETTPKIPIPEEQKESEAQPQTQPISDVSNSEGDVPKDE
jgi:parallel beta-helix repeat protein